MSKTLRGLARQAAAAGRSVQRQAKPLDEAAVSTIRGHLNGVVDVKAARNLALVAVLAQAGLCRSEAAALTWRDARIEDDGTGRITVRRSKSDQEGEGAVVAVQRDAAADLERLARLRGSREPDEPVFGVSAGQIARMVAAVARGAGLGDDYSGHSGRVGMAVRMTRKGAPAAAAVLRQGRWPTTTMLARYTRNEAAGEALRYL